MSKLSKAQHKYAFSTVTCFWTFNKLFETEKLHPCLSWAIVIHGSIDIKFGSDLVLYSTAGAQPGGAVSPPKFSKHCIAILAFAETFNNKVEILYCNHFSEKSYWTFSWSYLSPDKIYFETGHLIKNFVKDWYLTTNMLELGDGLQCW